MIQNGRQRRLPRVDYLYWYFIQFTHVLKNKRICLHPQHGKRQTSGRPTRRAFEFQPKVVCCRHFRKQAFYESDPPWKEI